MKIIHTNMPITQAANCSNTTYVINPVRIHEMDKSWLNQKMLDLMPDIKEKIREYEDYVSRHPEAKTLPIILVRPVSYKNFTVLTILLDQDDDKDRENLFLVADRMKDLCSLNCILRMVANSDVISDENWKIFQSRINENMSHPTYVLELHEGNSNMIMCETCLHRPVCKYYEAKKIPNTCTHYYHFEN